MNILFRRAGFWRRFISGLMAFVFAMGFVGTSYAQSVSALPLPGTMVGLSQPFNPPVLKGIKVYPDAPLRFDFILDKGDSDKADSELRDESNRLIKYFLASLTIPEKDLWVNLSPYEKDRIVPEAFGRTEMGRDLLAQDYLLKQITASVIYPEGETGKKFWAEVYRQVQEKFGTTDIPVDTFNKVWIVPEKATVFENKTTAYVAGSHLKVMLESDYLAQAKDTEKAIFSSSASHEPSAEDNSRDLAKDVLRQVVIPVLEKEVNEGRNFAQLRQVYQSLILAVWYKRKIRESLFGKSYADKAKTLGIDISDKDEKEKIWQRYVEAFKKGAFNLVKEERDAVSQEIIPHKYFSGGAPFYTAFNNSEYQEYPKDMDDSSLKNEKILTVNMAILMDSPTVVKQSAAHDMQKLFNVWAKGKDHRDALIFEARKQGFEGRYFDDYEEKPLNGSGEKESYTAPLDEYMNFYDLYWNGINGNVIQHGFGNGVYFWRETGEGFEFMIMDYGSGVIRSDDRPVEDIGQIFDEHSYRGGRHSLDGAGHGSGAGLGMNVVAQHTYLTRAISVNDGKVRVVEKGTPGYYKWRSKGNKTVQTNYSFSDLGITGSGISGFIVQGFVPFNRSFTGKYSSISQESLFGKVLADKPSFKNRGSWQLLPADGLSQLKANDRVTLVFYRTGEERRDVMKKITVRSISEGGGLTDRDGTEYNPNYMKFLKINGNTDEVRGNLDVLKVLRNRNVRIGSTVEFLYDENVAVDERQEVTGVITAVPGPENQGVVEILPADGQKLSLSMAQVKEFRNEDFSENNDSARKAWRFSTEKADYIFYPDYDHSKETEIPPDIMKEVDAVVFETGWNEYDKMTNDEYKRYGGNLIEGMFNQNKPVFFVDVPMAKRFRGNEWGKIKFGLINMFLHYGPAIFGLAAQGLIFVSKKRSNWQKALHYLLLASFYTTTGCRSAVSARKIDDNISTMLREELGRKPKILIHYGAAHLDMIPMLKFKNIRNSVIFFHKNLGYPLLDKIYVKKIGRAEGHLGREAIKVLSVDVKKENAGGIDLTSGEKALAVQSSNGGIKFNMNPAMLPRLENAVGITPVIINIQPMIDLKLFLGLKGLAPAKELSMR